MSRGKGTQYDREHRQMLIFLNSLCICSLLTLVMFMCMTETIQYDTGDITNYFKQYIPNVDTMNREKVESLVVEYNVKDNFKNIGTVLHGWNRNMSSKPLIDAFKLRSDANNTTISSNTNEHRNFNHIKQTLILLFINNDYMTVFEIWYNYFQQAMMKSEQYVKHPSILMIVLASTTQYSNTTITCINCIITTRSDWLEIDNQFYPSDEIKNKLKINDKYYQAMWIFRYNVLCYLLHQLDMFNVLLTDIDAIWLKNPFVYFDKIVNQISQINDDNNNINNIKSKIDLNIIASRGRFPYPASIFGLQHHVSYTNFDKLCMGFVYFINNNVTQSLISGGKHEIMYEKRYEHNDQKTINFDIRGKYQLKFAMDIEIGDINLMQQDSNNNNNNNNKNIGVGELSASQYIEKFGGKHKSNVLIVKRDNINNVSLSIVLLRFDIFVRDCLKNKISTGKVLIAHCDTRGMFGQHKSYFFKYSFPYLLNGTWRQHMQHVKRMRDTNQTVPQSDF